MASFRYRSPPVSETAEVGIALCNHGGRRGDSLEKSGSSFGCVVWKPPRKSAKGAEGVEGVEVVVVLVAVLISVSAAFIMLLSDKRLVCPYFRYCVSVNGLGALGSRHCRAM